MRQRGHLLPHPKDKYKEKIKYKKEGGHKSKPSDK